MIGFIKKGRAMRILDLFCCSGGASMGLYDACRKVGIEPYVCGADIRKKGNYPFDHIQADVMSLSDDFIRSFDFVWASPPCQAYSLACIGSGAYYPDLVPGVRDLMYRAARSFCIENVPGAPLRRDLLLCGNGMFGIGVIRHRHFEVSGFRVYQPPHFMHTSKVLEGDLCTVAGNGFDGSAEVEDWQDAMGINWIEDRWELAQAVPPVYSQYIMSCYIGKPDLSLLLCRDLGFPEQDGFYQQERVLCGKHGCRCERGELHGPYWMRYREGKKKYIGLSYVSAGNSPYVASGGQSYVSSCAHDSYVAI